MTNPDQPELNMEAAKLFHDTYERLAPSFGYETRLDTKQFDPDSPNGKLMIAVCSEVIQQVSDQKVREFAEKAKETFRAGWMDDNTGDDEAGEICQTIDQTLTEYLSPTNCQHLNVNDMANRCTDCGLEWSEEEQAKWDQAR